MIKVIQTLLTDRVLKKKMNNTKRRRRLIILLRQRTDPETMHLVLTCLFSLHQSLDPQLLLRQKSLRSQLRLKRLQSGGMSREVFFNLCPGIFQLLQPFSSSGKLLLIDLDQGLCPGYGSSSSGNNLLCTLYDDFRFLGIANQPLMVTWKCWRWRASSAIYSSISFSSYS